MLLFKWFWLTKPNWSPGLCHIKYAWLKLSGHKVAAIMSFMVKLKAADFIGSIYSE